MFHLNPSIKKAGSGTSRRLDRGRHRVNFRLDTPGLQFSPVGFRYYAKRRRERLDLGGKHRSRVRYAMASGIRSAPRFHGA